MFSFSSAWLWASLLMLTLLYFWGRRVESRFSRLGIKSLQQRPPIIENILRNTLGWEHFTEAIKRAYVAFPGEKYVGQLQIVTPMILIKDLELLKLVTVKNFDHFQDHFGAFNADTDPLFGNSLFTLKGQKWRDMRATLSPAFTSSKMRNMFSLVVDCAKQMADFLEDQISKQADKTGILDIEMKDAYTRYTNDVIASTAFGIQVNSLDERDNEFYRMGKKATDFSGAVMLKFVLFITVPRLVKALGITLMSKDATEFFRSIIGDTMKSREKHGTVRPDMIQLLMEAKKGSLKHEAKDGAKVETKDAGFATVEESAVGKETVKRQWSDDELAAQAFLFFFAGFDTSSNLLCFMSHELALHPEIQERLQEEIDELMERTGGQLEYSELQNMKYMDMVVSETLRFWPPAFNTDRVCAKPYTLPPPNSTSKESYTMAVGECITIPIYWIHHDPQYFPDPEKFDPERFSDENKDSIVPFSYMPFGLGPRNCIGSRFALMEVKAVMVYILARFDIVVTGKTQIPLVLKTNTAGIQPVNGFRLGIKKRTKSKH